MDCAEQGGNDAGDREEGIVESGRGGSDINRGDGKVVDAIANSGNANDKSGYSDKINRNKRATLELVSLN